VVLGLLVEMMEAETLVLPPYYLPRLRSWQRFKRLLQVTIV
jgi:hypothetical protein